jgi:hypothetical protein
MNTADVLQYGHLTLLRAIDGLTDDALTTGGVCGWWSTRDILAHLASYEHVLVDVLNGFLNGGPTPHLDAFASEQFNDDQVAQRQGRSAGEILDEYNTAQAHIMALIARIPAETIRQPGTLPWYGAEYALDDFIVYTFYGHKREHSAQIAVFRDRTAQQS